MDIGTETGRDKLNSLLSMTYLDYFILCHLEKENEIKSTALEINVHSIILFYFVTTKNRTYMKMIHATGIENCVRINST